MIALPTVHEREPGQLNQNPFFYWNWAALEFNRLTHSLGGPHTGPTMSSRALGMVHLAIHDAYFAIKPPTHGHWKTFLVPYDPALELNPADKMGRPVCLPDRIAGAPDAIAAMAGAALSCLKRLYAPDDTAGLPYPLSVHGEFASAWDRIKTLYRDGYQYTPPAYPGRDDDLNTARLLEPAATLKAMPVSGASFEFGEMVANRIMQRLSIRDGEPGAGDAGYATPKPARFRFFDEPSNPIRRKQVDPTAEPLTNPPKKSVREYHGPFYGDDQTPRFSVSRNFVLADPPRDLNAAEKAEYLAALAEVKLRGGSPDINGTTRTPDQTVAALFWAYDGANLIGTPPRFYNQILRRVAWLQRKPQAIDDVKNVEECVRLFALANVAMTDAGILAWKEKYYHNYWRPLTGVREHGDGVGGTPGYGETLGGASGVGTVGDPFWEALGAPSTNTNDLSFKPPFPAYPSGHATFGAAAFQIARLHYNWRDGGLPDKRKPDKIDFDMISDELDGVSRDLVDPYDRNRPIEGQRGLIRTRVVRQFKSLWHAIYENAASRVYLGVHWRFDAFAAKDAVHPTQKGEDGLPLHKDAGDIDYMTQGTRSDGKPNVGIGGVPLGLAIADDIFDNGMAQSGIPVPATPFSFRINRQPTNIR